MTLPVRWGPDRWRLLLRAGVVGISLCCIGFAGGSLLLFSAAGLLGAAGGYVATLLVALAAGIWAGAGERPSEAVGGRQRWTVAALAVAAAGAFAVFWGNYPGGDLAPALSTFGLLPFAGAVYAVGLILPLMLGQARQAVALLEPEERWDALGTLCVSLLGAMAVAALLLGRVVLPWMGPGPLLFATGGLLVVPTLFPPRRDDGEERVVLQTESIVSEIEVVELRFPGRQPERRLYVNGEEESGELIRTGAPTLAYIVAAEEWLADVAARGDRYLFLGGGAYTLPRRVAERDPAADITVVEVDPAITAVAYELFCLRPDHGIRSVHGDARAVVDRLQREEGRFDRIFVDVYGGGEALPFSMVTREAFAGLRALLTPAGTLGINVIGNVVGPGSLRFWSIVESVGAAFPSVALYPHLGVDFPDRQNVLVTATAAQGTGTPERAGIFIRWPRGEWPRPRGAGVLRDVSGEPGALSGLASSPSAYSSESAESPPASAPPAAAFDPSASS